MSDAQNEYKQKLDRYNEFVYNYKFLHTKDELSWITIDDIIIHFIDIWGEVRKLHEVKNDKEKLNKQMDFIAQLCEAVYISENITGPYKESLKIAHYMIVDYYLNGNQLGQSEQGATKWFRQWCESYNLSLLSL